MVCRNTISAARTVAHIVTPGALAHERGEEVSCAAAGPVTSSGWLLRSQFILMRCQPGGLFSESTAGTQAVCFLVTVFGKPRCSRPQLTPTSLFDFFLSRKNLNNCYIFKIIIIIS